ncbi:MAG TPA: biopolymer transporter ExbD [Opitutaceae bacterium]|nr:biopolymer transporter ExbD [Opitutaceae bacterium]
MARNFRRHHSATAHPIADLNVTNLIDLGFMLLIIFMVATPLIQQEQTLPVNLPIESPSTQAKPDPRDKFETITIRANGSYTLGGRTLTLAQLSREFARFAGETRPPIFRLRVDAEATAQQFVSVMDEMKKHNLSKFTLDTKTSG